LSIEWQLYTVCPLKAAWPLPTQTRSFTSAKMNVWFQQQQPCGFRDRAKDPLPTEAGWIAVGSLGHFEAGAARD